MHLRPHNVHRNLSNVVHIVGYSHGEPRKGQLLQHSGTKPNVRQRKCTTYRACLDSCPENVIATLPDGTAQINDATCVGCGECIANCRSDAVAFSWNTASFNMRENIAEHIRGTVHSLAG